jgi:hypothetical protein
VRQELLFYFLKHWVSREAQLQQQEGFLGLQVCVAGTKEGLVCNCARPSNACMSSCKLIWLKGCGPVHPALATK